MTWWKKDWFIAKIKHPRHNGGPRRNTSLATPRPLQEPEKPVDPRKVIAAIITINAVIAYCLFRWKRMGVLDEEEKTENDAIEAAVDVSKPETRGPFRRFLTGFGAGVSAALARARHSKE